MLRPMCGDGEIYLAICLLPSVNTDATLKPSQWLSVTLRLVGRRFGPWLGQTNAQTLCSGLDLNHSSDSQAWNHCSLRGRRWVKSETDFTSCGIVTFWGLLNT